MSRINYVQGDATEPIPTNTQAECPCLTFNEKQCAQDGPCYHRTGKGTCVTCGGTGILQETLLRAFHLLMTAVEQPNGDLLILAAARKASNDKVKGTRKRNKRKSDQEAAAILDQMVAATSLR